MGPIPKINWTKIAAIIGVVGGAYTAVAHIRSDIQANRDSLIKQASDEATRKAESNAYKMRVEARLEELEKRCSFFAMDSIRDAINELDNKTHLKPKF